jgi:hypothetical protein
LDVAAGAEATLADWAMFADWATFADWAVFADWAAFWPKLRLDLKPSQPLAAKIAATNNPAVAIRCNRIRASPWLSL